jgi:hypothetical protein
MDEFFRHPHFDHSLPFWVDRNSTFFVTLCAQHRCENHFCRSGIGTTCLRLFEYTTTIRGGSAR